MCIPFIPGNLNICKRIIRSCNNRSLCHIRQFCQVIRNIHALVIIFFFENIISNGIMMNCDMTDQWFQHSGNLIIPVASQIISACDQFNRWIHPFHRFRKIQSFFCIFFCTARSKLPVTIHLISKSPVFYMERFLISQFSSHVRILCIACSVTKFHPMHSFFSRSTSHIHTKVRFCACLLTQFYKFYSTHAIVIFRQPCIVKYFWSFFLWSDSIFPMIIRNKISSRIS